MARILERLAEIPATASREEIIAFLGLPNDPTGGSVSSTHCDLTWETAPGYRFVLSFDPAFRDGTLALEFVETGFSARRKAGFPPDEFHTIYPYRSRKGMHYE